MIERVVAERVLKHFDMMKEQPIDLHKICRVQGIKIMPLSNNGDGASSQFTISEDVPIILINEERSDLHKRICLAHCLGHYFMNHNTMPRDTKSVLNNGSEYEISANRFGHELIMPKQIVENFLDRSFSQSEMARRFDVSYESMGYRLENIGYEYDREYTF